MTFFFLKSKEIKCKNNNTRLGFWNRVFPVGQEEEQEGQTLSREPESGSKTQKSQERLVADK